MRHTSNLQGSYFNSSLIDIQSGRDDVVELIVPVNDIAIRIGNVRSANIVALSAFVAKTKLVSMETLLSCVQSEFAKKVDMISLNLVAVEEGKKAIQKTGQI